MKTNLVPCLDLIITENEGGFSDHPDDPGGPTNMGITLATLQAWRKTDSTVEDLKNLQRVEVEAIISSEYATPIKFNALPPGLDYCVLDCSVNSGPARAAKILQSLLGVVEDGIIGAKTLEALGQPDSNQLLVAIEHYSDARLSFLRSLKTWNTFGNGWTARVERVQVRAEKLAVGRTPAAGTGVIPKDYEVEDGGIAKGGGEQKLSSTEHGMNSIAVLVTAVITLGAAAAQAAQTLMPYADIAAIKWVLAGLAVVSSAGTMATTMRQAAKGG